ncbi:MAG: class I SAM-dependent methyltransferase [Candidatus Glassbacteria bacterium]|nr:class I SAM-dependent methyltransferase [Candidatus Glassbacteria bacterium]
MGGSSVIGERIVPEQFRVAKKQYLLYLRHYFIYDWALGRIDSGANLLEVGCGEGYGTDMFARKIAKVTGLDLNEEAVAHASARYAADNCEFTSYDGTRFPFNTETFDAAVSFQVIEHVDDDAMFVAEISRVLKPGGMLLMTTPNRLLRLDPGQTPWNRYHKREYSPADLKEVLSAKFSGVQICAIKGSPEVQRVLTSNLRANNPVAAALKRHMSESLKLSLLRLKAALPSFLGGDRKREYLEKYSYHDFSVVAGEAGGGLDLLAICRK